jgi:hemolysin activation/secretion protein
VNAVRILLALAIGAAGQGLAAQEVLDRTNPAQEIERDRPLAPADKKLRIEIQPVLDMPGSAGAGAGGDLEVGAILIDGLTALSAADFGPVIEPFAGRVLDQAALRQLVDDIANHARKQGYILATAWIPEQTLTGGMLRVRVDEGAIDAVRIEGSDDPVIRRQLERLLAIRPLTLAALERELLLARDLPGVWVRSTRFERDGDTRVLMVDARREDFSGRVLFATDGTKPVGPVRARIDLDANGLISPTDRVDLSFSTTPFEPDELAFFSARYSVVVNGSGTTIGASGAVSSTRPGAYLANRELEGTFWQTGVQMRHPLLRRRQRSLWLEAAAELQNLQQDSFGRLARQDRIALARLGFYGFGPLAGGTLQGRATITRGLDILGATALGDPLASRSDAPPGFTTATWWLAWQRGLGQRLSLSLATIGQLSTDPLLIGESFVLGGNAFLRGYDFAQRTGDQGVAGLGELRYDVPGRFAGLERLQLYAFADGGTVTNLASGLGSGTLASSGAGLRADITRALDLDFEVAVPLTEPRYDTNDNTPRLNLRVSQSF